LVEKEEEMKSGKRKMKESKGRNRQPCETHGEADFWSEEDSDKSKGDD
jgi:hypothetical protein